MFAVPFDKQFRTRVHLLSATIRDGFDKGKVEFLSCVLLQVLPSLCTERCLAFGDQDKIFPFVLCWRSLSLSHTLVLL